VILRWFVLFFSVFLGSNATAFTDVEKAGFALTSLPPNTIRATRDQRANMASEIYEYWSILDKRLPRLSPTDAEWVRGEFLSNDGIRVARIINTPEYHLLSLGNLVDRCLDGSQALTHVFVSDPPQNTEMFYWTKVAECYHSSEAYISKHLRETGLIEDDSSIKGHSFDHMILSKILKIIIPSAMADEMGWDLSKN
jgi:hypothetical protein